MICPVCSQLVDMLFLTVEGHRCRSCKRGVLQTANDVWCKTPEEYAYWIKKFRDAGRDIDALILEARQMTIEPE